MKDLWVKEFKEAKSNKEGILDRIKFHGGLTDQLISENSGLSIQTVRKHLKTLSVEGKIQIVQFGDGILRVKAL